MSETSVENFSRSFASRNREGKEGMVMVQFWSCKGFSNLWDAYIHVRENKAANQYFAGRAIYDGIANQSKSWLIETFGQGRVLFFPGWRGNAGLSDATSDMAYAPVNDIDRFGFVKSNESTPWNENVCRILTYTAPQ